MQMLMMGPGVKGGTTKVMGVVLLYRNDTGKGFHITLDGGGRDLGPTLHEAAHCAQKNLDRLAREGHPLATVLDYMERALGEVARRHVPEVPGTRADAGTALTHLLTLRSFGRAEDSDEYTGIVVVSAGSGLYKPPVLTWNGADEGIA